MSILRKSYVCQIALGLAILAAPSAMFAVSNPDCTLIVPAHPLTAAGLATPYQLVATDPTHGPCHETNADQSAFVEAAIINLITGQISIYHPVVVDAMTAPAVPPIVPTLPPLNVVAIWFGYNADGSLTLSGAVPSALSDGDCHQGLGQFAYCNASAFFASANVEILLGFLHVPNIGTGTDGLPCPTVRHFAVVDQDQSDNLLTTYWGLPSGQVMQFSAANKASHPTGFLVKNASDNRTLDLFVDKALGCSPWTAPDLNDASNLVSALALNELQAAAYQAAPIALIPLNDPFVGNDLIKVNEYRTGVNQIPAFLPSLASPTSYCPNMRAVAISRLNTDKPQFTAFASPQPIATNLFTFMAQRLDASYVNLGCQALLGQPSPVHLTIVGGVVTAATIM